MPLRWDDDSSIFTDLPWSAHNAETGVLSVNNRVNRTAPRMTVECGSKLVLDYGALFGGWYKFRPKFEAIALPAHEGLPEKPADPEFKQGIQIQLLIEGIGMTFFTNTATFNINAINRYIGQFRRCPEAIAGQLPIYTLLVSDPVVWGEGTFYPIKLDLVAWTDRDESVFGARFVPPPRGRAAPVVVGFTPPTLLPSAAEQSPSPPPLPASTDTGQTAATASSVAPAIAPASVPAAPAAPDVPFDDEHVVQSSAAAPTTPATPTVPAAAVSPAPDPFAVFRRGNNPTPLPIPKPRNAA
jgi:hypothetical protein